MKCTHCGRESSNDAKFCEFCGEPLEIHANEQPTCPNCGEPIEAGSKFCGKCGMAIPEPASPVAEKFESIKTNISEKLDKKKITGIIIGAAALVCIIIVAAIFLNQKDTVYLIGDLSLDSTAYFFDSEKGRSGNYLSYPEEHITNKVNKPDDVDEDAWETLLSCIAWKVEDKNNPQNGDKITISYSIDEEDYYVQDFEETYGYKVKCTTEDGDESTKIKLDGFPEYYYTAEDAVEAKKDVFQVAERFTKNQVEESNEYIENYKIKSTHVYYAVAKEDPEEHPTYVVVLVEATGDANGDGGSTTMVDGYIIGPFDSTVKEDDISENSEFLSDIDYMGLDEASSLKATVKELQQKDISMSYEYVLTEVTDNIK